MPSARPQGHFLVRFWRSAVGKKWVMAITGIMLLGFVLAHRHVTAAIIGPRTMDQLLDQLPLADRPLDDDVLDRIDALVAPGETLNTRDTGWDPPALVDPALRRRAR